VYPDVRQQKGAGVAFNALIQKMHELDVFALCEFVRKADEYNYLVALLPQVCLWVTRLYTHTLTETDTHTLHTHTRTHTHTCAHTHTRPQFPPRVCVCEQVYHYEDDDHKDPPGMNLIFIPFAEGKKVCVCVCVCVCMCVCVSCVCV